ncbi:MAG TPA: Hpt domain-containing protein, partial [Steroidobacteraceae bacterium]|nr:Hpt domain-containing protein [Steroidobacteraceae bacterium]
SIQPRGERLPAQVIDRLADAVVSLEYYMETLQAGRGDPWYMLDNAERCLAEVDARSVAVPPQEAATPVLEPATEQPAELEKTQIMKLTRGLPAAGGWHEAPGDLAPRPAPPAGRAAPAPPAGAGLDTEMLGVFIEEAREETEVVRGLFPMWEENPADRESLTRVRRAFHTLKGSGRMVGANALGEFAWSVENLLNRIIDGTRDRSPATMAVLRDSVAALPGLVDALERGDMTGSGAESLLARAQAMAEGTELPEALEPEPESGAKREPTVTVATLDEATVSSMLDRVPPLGAPVEKIPGEAPVPAGEAERGPAEEAVPPEAPAGEAAVPAVLAPTGEQEAPVHEPEEQPAYEAEAASYAGMDPSLQDIFRKEVQLHLDVLRDFLRKVWVTPGPHYVTDDLYRACHTLRGASRTAESGECIRLADPLHRWLRRLFDADRPFDEQGLGTLADAVAAFEDIVDGVGAAADYFPALQGLIARLSALDVALEQALAAEPAEPPTPAEQLAPPEPAPEAAAEPAAEEPAEAPLSLEHLIPAIPVETQTPRGRPGAGFDRLLPQSPAEQTVEGEMPYMARAEPPAEAEPPSEAPPPGGLVSEEPAGEAAADLHLPSVIEEVARAEGARYESVEEPPGGPVGEEPEGEPEPAEAAPGPAVEVSPEPRPDEAGQAADYDADIAAIFSEEATELLEAADSSLGALRAERGSRERVVELQRALHTLKGGARMAGITAMGDLSHELESLLIQVAGAATPLHERTFEVL